MDRWICLSVTAYRFHTSARAYRTPPTARPSNLQGSPGIQGFCLEPRGSVSHLPHCCHLPIFILIMIPTVTSREYASSVRNFNLCYNSAMEVFLLPNFAAEKVGLEARWPVQVTKLGNGGARIWTSLFFSVYLMFCNWVCSRYCVTGTWGGQKALGSKGTGVGK